MSHTISVDRVTTAFKVLVAGFVASLLATQLPNNSAIGVDEPVAQFAASGSTTDQLPQVESDSALILAVALASGVAVGVALKTKSNHNTSATRGSSLKPVHTTISLDRVNRKLEKKLLTLLHNDRGAANRLLAQALLKYPHKTNDWYAEKVIYDLERDRL